MAGEAHQEDGGLSPRTLWLGCLAWLLFACVAVALRGVRWDEDYEFAQVLSGLVSYPEGHPLFQYLRNAYNAQFYGSALLLCLWPSALILCFVRNALFLAATVVPPYLFGAVAGRRALWGHVTVLLILAGIHLEFDSSYPQFVWPGMFSNGHIGLGYGLVVLFLLLRGNLRAGLLMLGAMPCVHLGLMPPLLGFAVLAGVWATFRGHSVRIRRAMPWLAAGLAMSAAFWLIQRQFAVPLPESGPYAAPPLSSAEWGRYVNAHDIHRAFPAPNSYIALIGAVLLALGWAWACPGRTGARTFALGIAVYLLIIGAIVFVVMAVQSVMEARTPYLLVGWLPYRLLNQAPVLAVALMVGVLASEALPPRHSATTFALCLAFAVLFETANPLLSYALPPSIYGRYITGGTLVFFGLYGLAAARIADAFWAKRGASLAWLAAFVFGWVVLAWHHQFGAFCVALGLLAGLAFARWPVPLALPTVRAFAAAMCTLALAAMLWHQWVEREHLPRSEFDRDVAAYLESQGESDAMLCVPMDQLMSQARTGHPVIADMATRYFGSYMPGLGAATVKLYRDIYGVDFLRENGLPCRNWREVWSARPKQEWQRLGAEYGFSYVVAPEDVPVGLESVIENTGRTLYRIPR